MNQFNSGRVQSGLNIYNQDMKTLSVALKSSRPLVIQQSAVIMVQLGFNSVDIDSFFEENLVLNIATVLNLKPSQIRVVNAVNEDTLSRKKRDINMHRARATEEIIVFVVEIGDPPRQEKVNDSISIACTL